MADRNTSGSTPRVSAARLALAIRRLREEKENLALLASDPIAIVGMSCRFPGEAATPEKFWAALQEGRDCVGEIPAGRWADADALPPRMRRGGYIQEVEGFDAAYFGISPREALSMDPQQRLLLEVTWEALWDAGIEPASIARTDAGVFLAIYNNDYSRLHFRDTSTLTAHSGIGAAHSVAAGRISFLLNLQGPSLALDSACSSSLVAIHLACQSLRARECGLAIAAASSLKLLSDEVLVFSKWGMLASDGKCKTFDAGADGFTPGEGCGVLILKRLSDALQDGDRVRAVIRGTAVNHDGRTTVLTAPNGLAQEAVLRAALKNAMLEPGEVGYIETHGTGTSLGDPIEIEAIGNVYGGANEAPCILGAVKTNLGHLEASAGMAGVIKAVLCLENGEIPRNLHFERLNPEISLAGSRFKIPTERVPWARGAQPRVAAVSSFGLGGTNGHIIVEEAPLVPARDLNAGGRMIPLPGHAWQRQHFSIAPATAKGKIASAVSTSDFVHPLLQRRVESPFVQGMLFESDLNTAAYPYFNEHRLGESALLPFAAFLEMATEAAREMQHGKGSAIGNFAMVEPCFLSTESLRLQVLAGESTVEIASLGESGWRTHAKGSFETAVKSAGSMDLVSLRARCKQVISADDVYRRLEATGLSYGSLFRPIQSAWSGASDAGEALVHLRIDTALQPEAARYGIHPTLLDGCLQAVVIARGDAGNDLFLPISVDRFELHRPGAAELWVHAKILSASREAISLDLTIAEPSGAVVARMRGFTAKCTSAQQVSALANRSGVDDSSLSYEIAWRPAAPGAAAERQAGENWLLVETAEGSLGGLTALLVAQGAHCQKIRAVEFGTMTIEERTWAGVIFDARGIAAAPEGEWKHPEKDAVEFVLNFVRALADFAVPAPRLWLVASSAVAVLPGEDAAIAQAPLFGLVRTLCLEHPEIAATFLDVGSVEVSSGGASVELEKLLVQEITGAETESVVAFRNGVRYVPRLVPSKSAADAPRKLQISSSGRLEDLRLEISQRFAPNPHEVEIQVRAAGLNFRDVLTALGMLSARSTIPGGECSGTIVRVGAEVRDWKVGDDVLAFAPGSFQNFVNVDTNFVTHKPAAMRFAEVAGIPVAFLTAHHGLADLAKLSAGQTILIHAAAGGLGMAAVQMAIQAGSTVFATAGSAEKRAFLKQLGVEHVFDSRSLAFREQVLAVTGGAGVNVVLNSLAGDFIRASFDVVARDGCFLEVGKRGIWSAAEVEALGKNIRYFPFDLGDVALENPAQIATMLHELMARFAAGELHPLPTVVYGFDNSSDAFRTMAQARHIGKIVLGIAASEPETRLRDLLADGAVLITGGLGALGIETARWMAVQGTRKIILVGRSAQNPEHDSVIAELRALGVEIAIERANVASFEQMQQLLDRIRASGSPLQAVFHAAGVVEDAVLRKESWTSYCAATASKIEGAWNLHRLTEKDAMPLMVFFSSAASIFGSPGQGSYAAGNAFLDALAQHRASRGMRTLSVNWGAWASAGMAARLSPELAARSARQGSKPMAPAAALRVLERAIESGTAQAAILEMDWERFAGDGPARRDANFFSELIRQRASGKPQREKAGSAETEVGIVESLRSALPLERGSILSAEVKRCARRVLGLQDGAAIQDDIPLQDIGLDSLMALEMRNELAQSLGIALAAGLLFDYPSVDQLTAHLLNIFDDLATANREGVAGDRSAQAVNALSDEEAERMLIEELDRAEKEKANA
jgi:acyl transferase domain-containing protein/acyl carrier protein